MFAKAVLLKNIFEMKNFETWSSGVTFWSPQTSSAVHFQNITELVTVSYIYKEINYKFCSFYA